VLEGEYAECGVEPATVHGKRGDGADVDGVDDAAFCPGIGRMGTVCKRTMCGCKFKDEPRGVDASFKAWIAAQSACGTIEDVGVTAVGKSILWTEAFGVILPSPLKDASEYAFRSGTLVCLSTAIWEDDLTSSQADVGVRALATAMFGFWHPSKIGAEGDRMIAGWFNGKDLTVEVSGSELFGKL
jgi:hypothetical protein